ncbi:MAG: DUF839 domain-containing protein [Bdellovibrionales bacterium]|nr:DUF839 domain-containing protein [Bdellovibrionales bacterium]
MNQKSRRDFLKFMGVASAMGATSTMTGLLGCSLSPKNAMGANPALVPSRLNSLPPSFADELRLLPGLDFHILAKWGDSLNSKGDTFGYNNDFTAIFPLKTDPMDLIMMVNHEYPSDVFLRESPVGTPKTKTDIQNERKSLGVSLMRVQKDLRTKHWKVVQNDPHNRRIDGTTPIPFAGNAQIRGKKSATGTFANCAGGVTPWKTFLTCEENYDQMYGEIDYASGDHNKRIFHPTMDFGWHKQFEGEPEHYGYVVEVDPWTGRAKKLVSMGRFFHESALVLQASDKRCVVYMGDDANDQCLYKFIAAKPGTLDVGTLYAAKMDEGRWIPLDLKQTPLLASKFKTQQDILVRTREAAHLVGGTPLDRCEDVDQDPRTGAILVAASNNKPKKNYLGSILKIEENGGDLLSMSFKHSTFVAGSESSGLACPDNMAFDPQGNLWVCSDISGAETGKGPYKTFGNNSLFVIPMSGAQAGQVIRVATAPIDAELTGPSFTPDGETLFLSVQHPGELSTSYQNLTSHWPLGGNEIPRSALVAIQGPLLTKLCSTQGGLI